jgi:AraC-like DNA-binding protein
MRRCGVRRAHGRVKIVRSRLTWEVLGKGGAGPCCLRRLALCSGFRVAELGRLVGCSERSLRDAFVRDLGVRPKEWLRQERMVVARLRLAVGVFPGEVAYDLGFGSVEAFRREFLGCYGVSPARFMRHERRRRGVGPLAA